MPLDRHTMWYYKVSHASSFFPPQHSPVAHMRQHRYDPGVGGRRGVGFCRKHSALPGRVLLWHDEDRIPERIDPESPRQRRHLLPWVKLSGMGSRGLPDGAEGSTRCFKPVPALPQSQYSFPGCRRIRNHQSALHSATVFPAFRPNAFNCPQYSNQSSKKRIALLKITSTCLSKAV